MQFRQELNPSQQKFVNDFIHFKVIIANVIKTKQMLNAT